MTIRRHGRCLGDLRDPAHSGWRASSRLGCAGARGSGLSGGAADLVRPSRTGGPGCPRLPVLTRRRAGVGGYSRPCRRHHRHRCHRHRDSRVGGTSAHVLAKSPHRRTVRRHRLSNRRGAADGSRGCPEPSRLGRGYRAALPGSSPRPGRTGTDRAHSRNDCTAVRGARRCSGSAGERGSQGSGHRLRGRALPSAARDRDRIRRGGRGRQRAGQARIRAEVHGS